MKLNLGKLVKTATAAYFFYKANEETLKPVAKKAGKVVGIGKKKAPVE